MIYLDNGATSFPKAPGVTEAMTRFVQEDAANPGRSGHSMAKAAEAMVDRVRLKLSRLVKASGPERIVFSMNTTDALNIAIRSIVESPVRQGKKPKIITTVLEHNSVSRPLQAYAERGEIELVRVACSSCGTVNTQALLSEIPGSYAVVMTHASNVLGTIQPAQEIGVACREHGALFVLDVAQTIGVIEIDMQALKADMLAFPAHKSLLGPTGVGAVVVGDRVLEVCPLQANVNQHPRLWAFREGGTGSDSKTPLQPAELPYYLEGGTPNTVGLAGWDASLDWLLSQDMADIFAHESKLLQLMLDAFVGDERFVVYGKTTSEGRVAALSLNIKGHEQNPADIAMILDDTFQIAVRPGLHCAPYCHQAVGTFPDGTLRLSPGAFSTEEEVQQAIEALQEIASEMAMV